MAEPVYRKKDCKEGAVEHVYYVRDVKTGWQNLYIGKKILKKGAVEHVYYVRGVKTGWQNLYIGKKIEKVGGRTCILCQRC